MNRNCEICVHKRICDIWRGQECQDASCYVDDCFEQLSGDSLDAAFSRLGYETIPASVLPKTWDAAYAKSPDSVVVMGGRNIVLFCSGSNQVHVPADVVIATANLLKKANGGNQK